MGYGIGSEPVIEAVRRASTPFGVTDVAQVAAVASLGETGALRELDVAAACQPVAVRPFAGEGVRVTIGTAAANDRLLQPLGSLQR